jgi:CRP-like cAMP-binding protein
LIAVANERGGRDNITAVIVELPPDAIPGIDGPADEVEAMLRRSVLGYGLTSRDAHAIRLRMKVSEFAPGARVFEAGTRGREAHLVIGGAVRLTADGAPPRRIEAGEVIGEEHLLTGGFHYASLEATVEGPATIASLDRVSFRSLARDQPIAFSRLSLNFARQLTIRLGAAATALGDPVWRYANPDQTSTTTIRRSTMDLEPAELEEVEGADAPPQLPDEEHDIEVGVMDTSPAIDVSEIREPDEPEDESA